MEALVETTVRSRWLLNGQVINTIHTQMRKITQSKVPLIDPRSLTQYMREMQIGDQFKAPFKSRQTAFAFAQNADVKITSRKLSENPDGTSLYLVTRVIDSRAKVA